MSDKERNGNGGANPEPEDGKEPPTSRKPDYGKEPPATGGEPPEQTKSAEQAGQPWSTEQAGQPPSAEDSNTPPAEAEGLAPEWPPAEADKQEAGDPPASSANLPTATGAPPSAKPSGPEQGSVNRPPSPWKKGDVWKGIGLTVLLHLLQFLFPMAVLFIGISQLVYMIPAMILFRKKSGILQGLLIGAAITFLLNAACFGYFAFGFTNL
jgi:hypothetical protein